MDRIRGEYVMSNGEILKPIASLRFFSNFILELHTYPLYFIRILYGERTPCRKGRMNRSKYKVHGDIFHILWGGGSKWIGGQKGVESFPDMTQCGGKWDMQVGI